MRPAHRFNDLQFDNTGLRLPIRASTGTPKRHGNDWGVYGVIDQTILPGDKDGLHKLASFLRVGASPSDRNLVDFYADGGLTFTGLIPGRPTDLIGFGAAYDRISDAARAFDRDTRLFAAAAAIAGDPPAFAFPATRFAPVRDQEVMVEALYTINVTAWLTVDLDVQHFFHPSGHVLAASGPDIGKPIRGCDGLRLEHTDQILIAAPRRGTCACGGKADPSRIKFRRSRHVNCG